MASKQIPGASAHYPSLDGLRGLAILLVLFFHLFGFFYISRYGWIGVDLFFVLSGFLITNLLLAGRDKPFFAGKFYARRWLRTLPLYMVSLVVFLHIVPRFFGYARPLSYLVNNQAWFWLQVQNLLFFLKPDGNPGFLNHFWSLAVEEQFYLVVPVVFLLVRSPRSLGIGCVALLLLVEVARLVLWFAHVPGLSYEMTYTFTRIDGLCVGTALSLLRLSGSLLRPFVVFCAAFLIFAAGMLIWRFAFAFPLPLKATCLYPAVAIGWGLILWRSLRPAGLLEAMLRSRLLGFAGRVSYGWYIIHQPLHLLLLESRWHSLPVFQSVAGMTIFSLGSLLLSGLLAVAVFYGFERPLLSLKRFFR